MVLRKAIFHPRLERLNVSLCQAIGCWTSSWRRSGARLMWMWLCCLSQAGGQPPPEPGGCCLRGDLWHTEHLQPLCMCIDRNHGHMVQERSSMCRLFSDSPGISRGCRGTWRGVCWSNWQVWNSSPGCSTSKSRFGHHTYLRATEE